MNNPAENGQPRDWLNRPLTRDDPPSSEGSLLAATLAVGETNEVLGHKIDGLKAQRKGLTVLVVITCMALITFCVFGAIALQKISNTDNVANMLTDEQVIRDQAARADFRSDRQVFCINSYIASVHDPKVQYDARCPQAYPGVPINGLTP